MSPWTSRLDHLFVEHIPERVVSGVLYVSLSYDIAIHLCACGCGHRTVTPLSPTDWKITYDGQSVSLSPSIGNWSFPCSSHYWIRNGRVHQAPQMTDEEIRAGRESSERLTRQRLQASESGPASAARESRWERLLRKIRR
ncbi:MULTISPECIES: DUF6527 family protein [unclassified Nonomuraea]|uniref:DUF6527 family protein n=1 Tax=unclassified Nonomuraea TaxID=2593643 RepID=UPI0033ECE19C